MKKLSMLVLGLAFSTSALSHHGQEANTLLHFLSGAHLEYALAAVVVLFAGGLALRWYRHSSSED